MNKRSFQTRPARIITQARVLPAPSRRITLRERFLEIQNILQERCTKLRRHLFDREGLRREREIIRRRLSER